MNPINAALTQGFSNQSILQYLLRHFPHAKKQIEKAVAKGFTADKIIKYLQGGRQEVNRDETMTELEKTRATDIERKQNIKKNIGKGALALGATALGGYALSRALPRAATALQGELLPAEARASQALQLPNQTINAPQISNQQQQLPGPQQPPSQPEIPPVQPQQMAPEQAPVSPIQATPTPPMAAPQQPIAPLPGKVQNVLNGMLQSKKQQTPQEMAIALKNLYPKEVKEYEKTTKTPLIRAVEEFSKQVPKETEIAKSSMPIAGKSLAEVPPAEIKKEPQPEIEAPKEEVSKGSTVGLPNGNIGEIKDIRQGIATIESNGKEYRRKIEDLIEPPMPMKDLATLHEELIKGIEEKTGEEVSRMANWVGYDEGKKSLAFQPHGPNSKFYVYDDITEEEADELKSIEVMRKTSGENYIGVWKQGTKSVVGNRLFNLIRKIQMARGGKGKEYSYRFDSIYDALEPAKKASKEKHEREKDEKRKTKKPRSH